MAPNIRIVVAGPGELAEAVAGGLGRVMPGVERAEGWDVKPGVVDVAVVAGDGPAEVIVGFCKSIREKSRDAVIVVARDGAEGLVRMISGELGASSRVLGVGTVAHSLLFRGLIAHRCRVAEQEVHAFILGRSDGALVPLWSTAAIASVPLHHWAVAGHGKLGVRDRVEIFEGVKTGVSLANRVTAAVSVVEAVALGLGRILPVCTLLKAYAGMEGVCLSVPCVVNQEGAEVAVNVPLNAAEEAGVRNAVGNEG